MNWNEFFANVKRANYTACRQELSLEKPEGSEVNAQLDYFRTSTPAEEHEEQTILLEKDGPYCSGMRYLVRLNRGEAVALRDLLNQLLPEGES